MSAPEESRRTYTADDLPELRSVRECYREMIQKAKALQADQDDLEGQIAASLVVDDLRVKFDSLGVLLSRLEGLPPNCRLRGKNVDAVSRSSIGTAFAGALVRGGA